MVTIVYYSIQPRIGELIHHNSCEFSSDALATAWIEEMTRCYGDLFAVTRKVVL